MCGNIYNTFFMGFLYIIYDTFEKNITMHYPKIEFLRRVKGFTQQKMSIELEMDQAEYQRVESGQRNNIEDSLLSRIALVLGTTKEELASPQPYIFYVNNSDTASKNNAPFGNQEFHNDNAELMKILKTNMEQLNRLIENNQRLIEANLELISKFTNVAK